MMWSERRPLRAKSTRFSGWDSRPIALDRLSSTRFGYGSFVNTVLMGFQGRQAPGGRSESMTWLEGT